MNHINHIGHEWAEHPGECRGCAEELAQVAPSLMPLLEASLKQASLRNAAKSNAGREAGERTAPRK